MGPNVKDSAIFLLHYQETAVTRRSDYSAFRTAAVTAARATAGWAIVNCKTASVQCEFMGHTGNKVLVVKLTPCEGDSCEPEIASGADLDIYEGDLNNATEIADFALGLYIPGSGSIAGLDKLTNCAACVAGGGGWSGIRRSCGGYRNTQCSGGLDDYRDHREGFKEKMSTLTDCKSCVAAGYGWCSIQKLCGGFISKQCPEEEL